MRRRLKCYKPRLCDRHHISVGVGDHGWDTEHGFHLLKQICSSLPSTTRKVGSTAFHLQKAAAWRAFTRQTFKLLVSASCNRCLLRSSVCPQDCIFYRSSQIAGCKLALKSSCILAVEAGPSAVEASSPASALSRNPQTEKYAVVGESL